MATQSERGSAKTAKFRAVILNLFAGLQCAFAASTYTVGDSAGWDLGNDYSTWAKKYSFAVGDSIVFNYSTMHSVLQVSQADYQTCNINSPIRLFKSGKDTVTLTEPSSYFICGTPGHCQTGMKLAILTAGSTPSTPTTPPTPSNPVLPPPSNPLPPTPPGSTPPTLSSPLNPGPPTPFHSPPINPSTPAPPNPSSPSNPSPPTPSSPTSPTIPSDPAPPTPSRPTSPTAPSNPATPTPPNPTPPPPSNPTPPTPSYPTSGGTSPSGRTPSPLPSSSMRLQSGSALTLLTVFAAAIPFVL